ncbi:MAG: WD40-like beta propeller protein [Planctomycetota bacterium]|nr:MAG: WD40-like beta propeller protein [Planctomycetota bacterium]
MKCWTVLRQVVFRLTRSASEGDSRRDFPMPSLALRVNLAVLKLPLVLIAGLGIGQLLAAAEPIRLTTDGRVKRDPVFSKPDGSELLFAVLDRPKQLRLMKLTLANRKVESLHPDETRSEFEPAVSRDGRFLAFVQNRGNLSLAMVIKDLMNGTQVDVPPGGGFSGMHSPAIAPDNSRVLYSYPEEGRQHLFAVGIDAKNPTRLVDSSGVNNWPSFSPDGQQVVFSSTRDGDYDLYLMKSDGTNIRRLTESPKQDMSPNVTDTKTSCSSMYRVRKKIGGLEHSAKWRVTTAKCKVSANVKRHSFFTLHSSLFTSFVVRSAKTNAFQINSRIGSPSSSRCCGRPCGSVSVVRCGSMPRL